MMKRATVAAYVDLTEAGVEREVLAGRLPAPLDFGGKPHWRKDAIDAALALLSGEGDKPEWEVDLERRYGT